MVLTAVLADREVRVMLNSGANQNYISTTLSQRFDRYKRKKELPYSLSMANGSQSGLVTEYLH